MNENIQIARLGASVLRNTAQPITNTRDRQLIQLIDTLIDTAIAHKGVGIAAPQISKSCRLFIVSSHPSDRYPHAPKMQPTAMINPRILHRSPETVKDWEGCLSVPNVRGLVPRSRQIEVEYITREGEIQRQVLTDFVARIFQHELDHLDGILFIDRVEDKADLYTEAEYQQIINGQLTMDN